jgi:hypothetical protein
MYGLSNRTTNKNEKFIKFSSLRNGFLEKFINKDQEKKTSRLEFNEVLNILFMFLLLLRTIISVTIISDEDYILLIYMGRFWHYLSANYIHNEVLFILWTLNFICVYVFVINSPTKHYKWIEIYAFLKGILPHQQIGKYSNSFLIVSSFILFFLKLNVNKFKYRIR